MLAQFAAGELAQFSVGANSKGQEAVNKDQFTTSEELLREIEQW